MIYLTSDKLFEEDFELTIKDMNTSLYFIIPQALCKSIGLKNESKIKANVFIGNKGKFIAFWLDKNQEE